MEYNAQLQSLASKNRLRELTTCKMQGAMVEHGGQSYHQFAGNDYLGLAQDASLKKVAIAAINEHGCGANSSRFITGNHPLYDALETTLSGYYQTDAALVFGSGYLANLGAITSLVGTKDLIIMDKQAHACAYDAAALSGATLKRYRHNDMAQLCELLQQERGAYDKCLIVTETLFSMSGNIAPRDEIIALCHEHDALLLSDNAHGVGFAKPKSDPRHIIMGTFSKALGGYGGYVCADDLLIQIITQSARTLLFSTALPPATLASNKAALELVQAQPNRATKVINHAHAIQQSLGLEITDSPIIAITLGDEITTLKAQKTLQEAGFWVAAIRPPTVAPNQCQLRVSLHYEHVQETIDQLIHIINKEIIL